MKVGENVYSDRDYVVEELPGILSQATLKPTNNADKLDENPSYLSFTVPDPSIVYVAYDSRLTQRPFWLSLWMDTGQVLRISGHPKPFTVYAKSYPAGRVTLGGNTYGGSMYVVAVHSVKVAPPIEEPTPAPVVVDTPQPFEIISNEPGVITIRYPKPLNGLNLTLDMRPQK